MFKLYAYVNVYGTVTAQVSAADSARERYVGLRGYISPRAERYLCMHLHSLCR